MSIFIITHSYQAKHNDEYTVTSFKNKHNKNNNNRYKSKAVIQ